MALKSFCCYGFIPLLFVVGCGGGGGSSQQESSVSSSAQPEVIAECVVKQKVIVDPQAPVISLQGDRVVTLSIGSTYTDAGAVAFDPEDGELTSAIKITGLDKINTNVSADYLVRYDVTDKDSHAAQSVHRIIRVNDGITPKYSKRPFGESNTPMGFIEHLPTFLGDDSQELYPLIIYAHGWEHFVEQSPKNDRLMTLLYGANMFKAFAGNNWPDSRPFVMLEPQRCLEIGDGEWEQVDQFIDWALTAYPIDPDRIYMMGLSAGGYFTYRYPVLFPGRLAAIAPMSAGGPVGQMEVNSFCNAMKKLPIWAFHGDGDVTVPLSHSLYTFDVLNNQCPSPPTPTPLLTVVKGGDHVIINKIMTDSYIGLGDPDYTVQSQSVYDWFLQYTRVKD